jgi:hypothetical protein
MKTLTIPALASLCIALSPAVHAQCGSAPAASRLRAAAIPLHGVRAPHRELTPRAAASDTAADPTVVGLWDVLFITDGQLYDEGFDQYHADGTEIMNDITPLAGGNVCLGVWAKTGPKSFKLRHPFWIFDANGNLIGRGLLTEEFTLNTRGDAYVGSFAFQFRDLTDHTIPGMPDAAGTLSATRINAE